MEICAISIALSERDDHATILRHEKQFDVKYQMSYESFMRLAELLEPYLAQIGLPGCIVTVIEGLKSMGLTRTPTVLYYKDSSCRNPDCLWTINTKRCSI